MAPFRAATAADLDAIVALQRDYYAEDAYPFDAAISSRVIADFLANPDLGRLWVAERDGAIVAYCALTLGYSFEHRGRDAFLDELYVAPAFRDRGLGKEALALVDATCRALGVRALHLEVERDKDGAQALYRRWGFASTGRILMTKRVALE
jgi:ribosomal protein S18 acetylase RimI-like enzyme